MTQARWKTFEDKVRGIASLIFGKECSPSRIGGTDFDGVIEKNELETVVIEISVQEDLDKVRQGITRITAARQLLAVEGILVRGYIVLNRNPTEAMATLAKAAKISVGSAGQFASQLFKFPFYKTARLAASFGSSIDPNTGKVDTARYVPVRYELATNRSEIDIQGIADLLTSGKNVILLGEYGSGKSRCVRELFSLLSENWDINFQFPYAINLRECWGLERADEIVRRGAYVLGLDDVAASAVRTLNQGCLVLLLDGFDELGSQSWSADEARLRQLRYRSLQGVRDVIAKSQTGCLIAGREHYFNSDDEMLAALGLNRKNTVVIAAKDEFTPDELESYFDAAGLDVDLPSWLPRRPLICQTIALLSDEELGAMFGIKSEGVEFWNHFIKILCQRDARINTIFDADTIYRVFVALSRITRTRPANIGPISQRDLQEAFEDVVGQLPVEEAAVMLQRLPSLGRVGSESQDRQFVDMFILDGLRAKDVAAMPQGSEAQRQQVLKENWLNPLGTLGQSILTADIGIKIDPFRQLAARACTANNTTLAADIISALARAVSQEIDLLGIKLIGGTFSEFDLNGSTLKNIAVSEAVFERIVLPNSPPTNLNITKSLATSVSGAASYSGLPAWVQLESVDHFDAVQTVAQIRKAGLSPAHEILVAILKKTFRQKGSGRKEEALTRGFGGTSKKVSASILGLLMRENFLTRHKGDEGWIYSPSRTLQQRVDGILDQLRSSTDPLWQAVDSLN